MKELNTVDLRNQWEPLTTPELESLLQAELERKPPDDEKVILLLHILEAREKGIHIVNATCPFVSKIHNLVREAYSQGYSSAIATICREDSRLQPAFITRLTPADAKDSISSFRSGSKAGSFKWAWVSKSMVILLL